MGDLPPSTAPLLSANTQPATGENYSRYRRSRSLGISTVWYQALGIVTMTSFLCSTRSKSWESSSVGAIENLASISIVYHAHFRTSTSPLLRRSPASPGVVSGGEICHGGDSESKPCVTMGGSKAASGFGEGNDASSSFFFLSVSSRRSCLPRFLQTGTPKIETAVHTRKQGTRSLLTKCAVVECSNLCS
eukprot:SAG11_NODE_63_length_18904_cov_11.842914_4_plen_190_part_00